MTEYMKPEDLTAALAKIKAGDEVSALVACEEHEATVSGVAWIDDDGDPGPRRLVFLGDRVIRHVDGEPSSQLRAVLSHTPTTQPEPEGDVVVVDKAGGTWRRWWDSWRCPGRPIRSWARLNAEHGPLTIYRPADA